MFMAKNDVTVAGIDSGYGFTKALVHHAPPLIFPSVFAPAEDLFQSDIMGRKEPWDITVGGKRYLVGEPAASQSRLAMATASRQRVLSDEALVYAMMALAKLVPGGGSVNIVTGLPLSWMKDKGTLQNLLQGRHKVKLDGHEPWLYHVGKVEVIPQAFATLVRDAFEFNGVGFKVRDRKLLTEPSLFVDFGRLTINFMEMRGNQNVAERSGSLEFGMVRVLEQLQRRIFQELDVELSLSELDQALQTGHITVYGEHKRIGALAAPILDDIADRAVAKARSLWGAGELYSHVKLTGGGAILLGELFKQKYGHPRASVVTSPQFANVEGMLIYGLWMSSDKRW
jgi:plasmid segregation protein ParM